MTLDLTFLGTGNAFAPTRYWSSFLANDRYLFDAPPTLLAHLHRLGKDPNDIDVVFISHYHGDHYFGLPFLLLEFAELTPRTKDLTVVGPPGIAKRVQQVTDMAFNSVFRKDRGYPLHFVEAKDGREGEAAGCRFSARKVPHVESLECFAYRVEFDSGASLAYSGDTMMSDVLAPLAEGTDVFVCECSCWGDNCGPHLNPNEVLELRKQVGPETTFVLTHIGAGEAPAAIAEAGILIADDLKTIRIGRTRT